MLPLVLTLVIVIVVVFCRYSNRIMQTNEFGVATLLIKHLIAADSGEYR